MIKRLCITRTKSCINRPLIKRNYLDNTFSHNENGKLHSYSLEFTALPHIPHMVSPSPLLLSLDDTKVVKHGGGFLFTPMFS